MLADLRPPPARSSARTNRRSRFETRVGTIVGSSPPACWRWRPSAGAGMADGLAPPSVLMSDQFIKAFTARRLVGRVEDGTLYLDLARATRPGRPGVHDLPEGRRSSGTRSPEGAGATRRSWPRSRPPRPGALLRGRLRPIDGALPAADDGVRITGAGFKVGVTPSSSDPGPDEPTCARGYA